MRWWGAIRTGRLWIAPEPLKGDKLEKDGGRCGGSGGVRTARAGGGSGGKGGNYGSSGRGGSYGSSGRGEKGKTLSEFGDFDKVYYFLKLIFNDISISLTPISKYYILILHSLLYCFLEKHSIVFRI